MGLNPLTGLRTLLSAAVDKTTSHIPFGVGAKYNQDKALPGAYNYYNSPDVMKQRDAALLQNRAIGKNSRAEAENWYNTLKEANQREPLSFDPLVNRANRQAKQQLEAQLTNSRQLAQPQPQALQVLLNRGQQPFGMSQEDDYTPQMAIQNPGFTNQTSLNGQFIQGPGASELRRFLRY